MPEWAWLSGGEHERGGDPLEDRSVVMHVRTATVIEIFEENNFVPAAGALTYNFTHRSKSFNTDEHFVAVLHFSTTLTDEDDLLAVMERATRWYCDYCDWEDQNIATDEISRWN